MLKALKAGWIEKNADAFLTSLEAYAYPKLAKLRVDEIGTAHFLDVLTHCLECALIAVMRFKSG